MYKIAYKIALIQNQSEMSHYGYADARPILEEFGYQPILYTAQNIDELATDLTRLKFDAIIFASNALNDKTIRDNVMSPEFIKSFKDFINNKKGCLILHQLRMAKDEISFKFLPEPLNKIIPKVRNEEEKASEGEFRSTSIAKKNVCFLYPNDIDLSKVKNKCLSFKSLNGLYWHYWSNVNETDWNILLDDSGKDSLDRPLIITSKESEPFRIVLSSLTLDWQKQKELLENILSYIIEGKCDTAILKNYKNISFGFEYFIDCLRARKYPLHIYNAHDENLDNFVRNIKNGIHTIIIFGPFVNEDKIDKNTIILIKDYIKDGRIKLLSIKSDENFEKFYVAGREKFAYKLLHELEFKVQNILI